MQWLAGVTVQLLKWILPLLVHELIAAFKKWRADLAEKKHQQAIEKLKKAQTEEEQKDALRDIADNP